MSPRYLDPFLRLFEPPQLIDPSAKRHPLDVRFFREFIPLPTAPPPAPEVEAWHWTTYDGALVMRRGTGFSRELARLTPMADIVERFVREYAIFPPDFHAILNGNDFISVNGHDDTTAIPERRPYPPRETWAPRFAPRMAPPPPRPELCTDRLTGRKTAAKVRSSRASRLRECSGKRATLDELPLCAAEKPHCGHHSGWCAASTEPVP